MAQQTEEIILQIKTDNSEAITQMAKLTQETAKLKDENAKLSKSNKDASTAMKELAASGKKNSEEYKTLESAVNKNNATLEANKAAIKSLGSEYNGYQKQLTANITMQKANEGSLIQLGAELTKLNAEYARMSRTEKETTDRGKELKASIEAKSAAYKEEQMALGNTYVNVGNYQASMEAAIQKQTPFIAGLMNTAKVAKETGQSFGGALVSGLKATGQAMLKLLANPLVAALAVIAALLIGIVKIIKSNEEQMLRLNAVMAPFKRLLDGVLNVLQKMVDGVLSFIEFIMKGIGMVATLLEKLPLVGAAMKQINDETRESIELEKAKAALIEQNRANIVAFATIDKNISELKVKSMQKELYTEEQRLGFLKQANQLAIDKLKLQQDALKEELRIAEAEASRNKNSAEVNDRIAQLKADIIRAEQSYFNSVKENQEKINSFIATEAATRKAADDERIARQKEWADLYKENLKQIRDLTINLMQEGQAQEIKILEARLQDELEQIKGNAKQRAQIEKLLREQFEKDKQAITDKYELENLVKIEQRISEEMRIRAELAEKGSFERLQAQLQALEVEKQEAIRNATETGLDVSLVEQEFDLRRKEIIRTNEEETLAIRRDAYNQYINEKEAQFETELLKLYDNEIAKSELMITQEQNRLDTLLAMDATQKKALGLSEEQYAALVEEQRIKVNNAIKSNIDIQQQQFQKMEAGMFAVGDAVSSILNTMAQNTEEFGVFSKVAALFQIGVESAKSIAAAITGATAAAASKGPAAPYVIAGYIASMVATVVSGIAQAYNVIDNKNAPNAPSFATGGRVTGPGSATSDSILANVSNGESVMTAAATNMFAPLLSGINQMGGGVPIHVQGVVAQFEGEEMLARAFRRGIEGMPNPVVAVEEIQRVTRRVEVLENLRS